MLTRRSFIKSSSILVTASLMQTQMFARRKVKQKIVSVNGVIDAREMGFTLPHEHVLVDFIGAEKYNPKQWNHKDVIEKVLPFLEDVKRNGCKTFVDCTPDYLGRDVILLHQLSKLSGLNIITNTGYYGGSDNKFLPAHAFSETADQLAKRWIDESEKGIDGTSIKPGFIKISVNPDRLSDISKKLVQAAARCHKKTGLTIASHTGPSIPAFEQLDMLKQEGVFAHAFIWVHAQNEKDWSQYIKAARVGAWISLDGLADDNINEYVSRLKLLKAAKCLKNVLVSHDAGWYDPHKTNGGELKGYTTIFTKLIPALELEDFSEAEIFQIMEVNPRECFSVRKRLM